MKKDFEEAKKTIHQKELEISKLKTENANLNFIIMFLLPVLVGLVFISIACYSWGRSK